METTRTADDLRAELRRIDGKGYPAYRDLRGGWGLEAGTAVWIDHVQGDPFAAPSLVRLRAEMGGFPEALFEGSVRRVAFADWVARRAAAALERKRSGGRSGSGKSGMITIDSGGQEVLERSAVAVAPTWVELRIEVGLPAQGRRVLGRAAASLLIDDLRDLAGQCLSWAGADHAAAWRHVETAENWHAIHGQLDGLALAAFVADGSVLPRASGADDRPLGGGEAVPFASPEPLRVHVRVPNAVAGETTLSGMGIPPGVTLVVGGGYHGKSTLLKALEHGVYPHVPGDGREYVVCDRAAVKVRAEDGRRVEGVDISPFIRDLPDGRATRAFRTEDASGSTSQAANIVEALEAGARVLLLDEDTSATNFMVRDARMQALVHRDAEPITPFLERVRELWESRGVSTVLVMGGCGDYFDVADTVVAMRGFQPHEVTAEARAVAAAHPTGRNREARTPAGAPAPRIPVAASLDASRGRRDVKVTVRERDLLEFGTTRIDLRGVGQIIDRSQTRALGLALYHAARHLMADGRPVAAVLDRLDALMDSEGLDLLSPHARPGEHPGALARPRRFEIAAALNRLRTLRVVSEK